MRRPSPLAQTLAASVAAFALASCDDAGNIADTDGGPFSNIHADGGGDGRLGRRRTLAQAAAPAPVPRTPKWTPRRHRGRGRREGRGTDAPVDGRRAAGGRARRPARAARQEQAARAGAPPRRRPATECEAANCIKGTTKFAYTGCFNPVDDQENPAKATGGPAQGILKSVLCQAVLDCVRTNICEVQCDQNGLLGKDWSGKPLVSMIEDWKAVFDRPTRVCRPDADCESHCRPGTGRYSSPVAIAASAPIQTSATPSECKTGPAKLPSRMPRR